MVNSRCIFDLNQQVLFYTLHSVEGRASLLRLYPVEEYVKWTFMGTHFRIHECECWDYALKVCGQISPFLMPSLFPNGPYNTIHPFHADYGKAFLLLLYEKDGVL